jgi:hypothetical protein
MNERIQKLALQAGYTKDNFGVGHWDMPEFKKFSELLLQDCMSICEDLGDKGLDGHYCVDKIRKEFGV